MAVFYPPNPTNADPPEAAHVEGGVYILRNEAQSQVVGMSYGQGLWFYGLLRAQDDASTPQIVIDQRFLVSRVPGESSFSIINLFYGVPIGNFKAVQGLQKLYASPDTAGDQLTQWYIADVSDNGKKWIFHPPTSIEQFSSGWDVEHSKRDADLCSSSLWSTYDTSLSQHWSFEKNTKTVPDPASDSWYTVWPIADYEEGLSSAKWMGSIPDDTPLSRINIPGTHQSLALHGTLLVGSARGMPTNYDKLTRLDNPRCQNRSPYEQLHEGIRSLDLRLHMLTDQYTKENTLYARHGQGIGVDEGYSLMAVLHSLKLFLLANSGETVLVEVTNTYNASILPFWGAFLKDVKLFVDHYPNIVFSALDGPLGAIKLSDCRGKIMFISKQLWENKTAVLQNFPKLSFPGDIHAFLNPDELFKNMKKEDQYNVAKGKWNEKLDNCRKNIEAALADTQHQTLYYTSWNASDGASILNSYNPWEFARYSTASPTAETDPNSKIQNLLVKSRLGEGTSDTYKYIGFVVFDFYELCGDAIEAVIKSNRGCGQLNNFKRRPLKAGM